MKKNTIKQIQMSPETLKVYELIPELLNLTGYEIVDFLSNVDCNLIIMVGNDTITGEPIYVQYPTGKIYTGPIPFLNSIT